MSEWADREERRADARSEYERIMTTPSPEPMGAFIETGVVGFVFGEMWRRGVLTARDRRWITLSCVGAAGAITPIETHVWAALNSSDVSYPEFDEFVLHFGTQLGWPRASVLSMHGMTSIFRLAKERGVELDAQDFELWVEPVDDDARRARGEAAYLAVHGVPPETPRTAFRGRAHLDFLYGEIWTRETVPEPPRPPDHQHLLRRCCRRRRGDGRPAARRADPGRPDLRGAPGARDALRRVPRLAVGPAAR